MRKNNLILLGIAATIIFAIVKIFLVHSIPSIAHCYRDFDDFLFIQHAESIIKGEWFGAFSDKTLVKGPMYPLFIAFNHFTGISLKFSEYLLYLVSIVLLTIGTYKLFTNKLLSIFLLGLLLLNPYVEVINRVMRESIYTAQMIIIISAICLIHHYKRNIGKQITCYLLLAFTSFTFWYNREEGIWILPLLVLFLSWSLFFEQNRIKLPNRKSLFPPLLGIVVFLSLQFWLKSQTRILYDTTRIVDLMTPESKEALKAIYRVKFDFTPYIATPPEVRNKLYQHSSKFKMIEDEMEKYAKNKNYLCHFHPEVCYKISTDMLVWYLRYAINDIGLYTDPQTVAKFYSEMADEINQACDQGLIDCNERRNVYTVHLRNKSDYKRLIASFFKGITLLKTGTRPLGMGNLFSPSKCQDDERFDRYRYVTNSSREKMYVSTDSWNSEDQRANKKKRILQNLHVLNILKKFNDKIVLPIIFYCTIILILVSLYFLVRKKQVNISLILFIGVFGIMLTRIALLSLIDTTTFPGFDTRYVACLYPLMLISFVALLDYCSDIYRTPQEN